MSYTPYQSEETLTASRNIPWAGEEGGQSAVSKGTGLLIGGEVERKETDLKEVVVGCCGRAKALGRGGRQGEGEVVGIK
jgi:hypothetical protein